MGNHDDRTWPERVVGTWSGLIGMWMGSLEHIRTGLLEHGRTNLSEHGLTHWKMAGTNRNKKKNPFEQGNEQDLS